jgi:hypothetical protein
MQFLLLIHHVESERYARNSDEEAAVYNEYRQLMQELSAGGKLLGGDELKPTSSATTIRVRNGKRTVTDGPFAETKEQLGGYFLVNVNDLDEALAIAARIPTARTGSIEVRPVKAREQAAKT